MQKLVKPFLWPFLILIVMACNMRETDPKAQAIVDKSIAFHGVKAIKNARIDFDFRDKHYRSTRQGDSFLYERIFKDEDGQEVHDQLSNEGFERMVDGRLINLNELDQEKYSNSVNSVVYFALLPLFLNDLAVIKEYEESVLINGVQMDKLRISFRREGGGEDYDDVFYYWFDGDGHLKHLAYSEGGNRFRAVLDTARVNGVLFNNYINYEGPKPDLTPLSDYDKLFESGKLPELSRIIIENITVDIFN
jgi:hypothetical protein